MREVSLNAIQAKILRRMFEQDGLRFSEINTDKLPTDQFSYHLRQLSKANLVEKTPDRTYRLTNFGRSKAIMLSPNGTSFIQQGFIAVLLMTSKTENGQELFLVQRRTKVTNKGKIGFFGDKVRYGEDTHAAAKRALTAQTGLTGEPQLHGIWHLMDKLGDTIVEDRYFFVYRCIEPQGELQKVGITGENMWMTRADLEASGAMFHADHQYMDSIGAPPHVIYHEQLTEIESY